MANEQNKKLVLAAMMALVVITLLWMVFKKDSVNNQSVQNSQAISYSLSTSEQSANEHSTNESLKIVEAVLNDEFEKASAQQKQLAQEQFDLATQYIANKDWEKAEPLLSGLTKRHPSLVEPYINLAFLYARNNRLSDAREILVRGIGANENYQLLFSNLQSIHGALAAEAYRSALISDDFPEQQLPIANLEMNLSLVSSLELTKVDEDLQQSLLAEIEQLQASQTQAQSSDSALASQITELEAKLVAANSRNQQQEASFTARIKALDALVNSQTLASQQTSNEIENQLALNDELVATSQGSSTVNESVIENNVVAEKDQITEVEKVIGIQLVEEWASRWSEQDVQGYIQRYANNYRPSNDQISHSEWREQRRVRLTNKSYIEIEVDDFEFEESDDQFSVIFSQRYQSNTMDDTIVKKLVFTKNNDSWREAKIIDEIIVRS